MEQATKTAVKRYQIELFWEGLSGDDRKIGKYVLTENALEKLEEQYKYVLAIDVWDETNQKPISYTKLIDELTKIGKEKGLFKNGGEVSVDDMQNNEMFQCFTLLENELKESPFAIEDKIIDSDRNIVVYFRKEPFQKVETIKAQQFLSKYTNPNIKPAICKIFSHFEVKDNKIIAHVKGSIYNNGGQLKQAKLWEVLTQDSPTSPYIVRADELTKTESQDLAARLEASNKYHNVRYETSLPFANGGQTEVFTVKKLGDDYYPYGLYLGDDLMSGLENNNENYVESKKQAILKKLKQEKEAIKTYSNKDFSLKEEVLINIGVQPGKGAGSFWVTAVVTDIHPNRLTLSRTTPFGEKEETNIANKYLTSEYIIKLQDADFFEQGGKIQTTAKGASGRYHILGEAEVKLTPEERKRLDELQKREDVDELTKAEEAEYDNLVLKYRKTKEYKHYKHHQPVLYASTNDKTAIASIVKSAEKDLEELSGVKHHVFVTDTVEDRQIYNYANGGEVMEGDRVTITTSSLGEKYKGMNGVITDRKLLNNKYSIKLEDGMEMAFDRDEFKHNSINPRYAQGGQLATTEENIKKLQKALDNKYIPAELKTSISSKIEELKEQLKKETEPIPTAPKKEEITIKDLQARLTITKKMAAKKPELKARVRIIEKMIAKMKENKPSKEEIDKFVEYVASFYGKKDGLYKKDYNGGFTNEEIRIAAEKYINDPKTNWGGGDSVDRELMRDLYLAPLVDLNIDNISDELKEKSGKYKTIHQNDLKKGEKYINTNTGDIMTFDRIEDGSVIDSDGVYHAAEKYYEVKKLFSVNPSAIGKVKYSISTYDGGTHKDGSPFIGISTYKTKEDLTKGIKNYKDEGFTEVDSVFNELHDKKFQQGGEVENEHTFTYMMLSRLQMDNDYFLGAANGYEKVLWAGNVDDQIAEMKKLWNSLPKDGKPEWLSMQEIVDYERKMKNFKKKDVPQLEQGGIIGKKFKNEEDVLFIGYGSADIYEGKLKLFKGTWYLLQNDLKPKSNLFSDDEREGFKYASYIGESVRDSYKQGIIIQKKETSKLKNGGTIQDNEFKVGNVVANTKHKTIGIVRDVFSDGGGDVRTDADGVVNISDLERYDIFKHKDYTIAPSTKKEIENAVSRRKIWGVEVRKTENSPYEEIASDLTKEEAYKLEEELKDSGKYYYVKAEVPLPFKNVGEISVDKTVVITGGNPKYVGKKAIVRAVYPNKVSVEIPGTPFASFVDNGKTFYNNTLMDKKHVSLKNGGEIPYKIGDKVWAWFDNVAYQAEIIDYHVKDNLYKVRLETNAEEWVNPSQIEHKDTMKNGGEVQKGLLRKTWDNENDRFIYDTRIELLKQVGFTTKKGLPDNQAKRAAELEFDKLPLNVKYPLMEHFNKGKLVLKQGGEIKKIDFKTMDYEKLVGDESANYPYYSVKNADTQDIFEEKTEQKVATWYMQEQELKINPKAPKEQKQQLINWLKQNSYIRN